MNHRQAADAITHDMHGSTFTSFVAPKFGDGELCAWRVDVPARTTGMPHVVSREEVLLVLSGSVHASVDGVDHRAEPGEVVVVPAGASFCLTTADAPAAAWVVTSVGLEAVTADGQRISPPWVR